MGETEACKTVHESCGNLCIKVIPTWPRQRFRHSDSGQFPYARLLVIYLAIEDCVKMSKESIHPNAHVHIFR